METAVIAIVISSIAIILTLLRDFIKPLIFKPRIRIDGIDDGECIEDASDDVNIPSVKLSRWVRLRIKNKNSFFSVPAKNCYVKLLSIESRGKKIIPFNPLPLTWVSYDDFQGGKHNLSVGEDHLIDLVHEKSYVDRILNFKINLPLELRKKALTEFRPGEYIFKIGVYGDNFKSQKKEFKIKLQKKYGKLNFSR